MTADEKLETAVAKHTAPMIAKQDTLAKIVDNLREATAKIEAKLRDTDRILKDRITGKPDYSTSDKRTIDMLCKDVKEDRYDSET